MENFYRQFFQNLKLKKGVSMSKIICVDGVVGVGKSSLSKLLSEKYGITLFEEPVVDNPILDKFYYHKSRWSFPLQVFFLNKRFKLIKKASKLANCVMDRSIYGDVIFSKMLVDDHEMSEEEYHLYEELLHNMLEHVQKPALMIYLEISVDNAVKRIKKRNRDYEQVVAREYWQHLDNHYRNYFDHYNLSPILKINVDDLDFVENPQDAEKILKLIEDKLAEIQYFN